MKKCCVAPWVAAGQSKEDYYKTKAELKKIEQETPRQSNVNQMKKHVVRNPDIDFKPQPNVNPVHKKSFFGIFSSKLYK